MGRSLLVTVGISLKSNAERALEKRELTEHDLRLFLRQKEREENGLVEASAETNSLLRLGVGKEDRVHFLHSSTPEGEMCAKALSGFYERRVEHVEVKSIPELDYKESRFKMRGLRNLVTELAYLIRREQRKGRETVIVATGGFKAELAYATLVGILFKVPIYYIHERFEEIVDLPPVPVDWDFSLVEKHREFLEWVEKGQPKDKVEKGFLNKLSLEERKKITLLLLEEEEHYFLSPTGEAVLQAYAERKGG